MPSVMQFRAHRLDPAHLLQSASMSRSLGSRQAAPMQKRPEPDALASAAAASTASASINFSALRPDLAKADCEQ
jgi:hypothetical protein